MPSPKNTTSPSLINSSCIEKNIKFKDIMSLIPQLDSLSDYLEEKRSKKDILDYKSELYLINEIIPNLVNEIQITHNIIDRKIKKLRIKYASVDDKGRLILDINKEFVYTPESLLDLNTEIEELEADTFFALVSNKDTLISIESELGKYPIKHQLTLRNILKLFK